MRHPVFLKSEIFPNLSRLVSTGIADAFEGAFDQLFPLLADVVIDRRHRLNRAGGRTGEGEFAVGHLALIEGEWTVAKDNEAAIREIAGFVFMEIKDDFFVGECVFGNLHGIFLEEASGGTNHSAPQIAWIWRK